jgi:hypothetical protein
VSRQSGWGEAAASPALSASGGVSPTPFWAASGAGASPGLAGGKNVSSFMGYPEGRYCPAYLILTNQG